MAFVSEIFDQLRDLLNDAADTQVPFATKKLYVNRGIARLWPKVWSVGTTSVALTNGTYDYTMSVLVMDGHLLSVEINTLADPAHYRRFDGYDLLPGDEDLVGRLVVSQNPVTGTSLRIKYAQPVPLITSASYAAAQAETWVGPDRAIGLPVAYAMGMITGRKLDDRQDTNRYNTTQATNGVTDQDIMAASQLWLAQFELELDDMARPLPPARD